MCIEGKSRMTYFRSIVFLQMHKCLTHSSLFAFGVSKNYTSYATNISSENHFCQLEINFLFLELISRLLQYILGLLKFISTSSKIGLHFIFSEVHSPISKIFERILLAHVKTFNILLRFHSAHLQTSWVYDHSPCVVMRP